MGKKSKRIPSLLTTTSLHWPAKLFVRFHLAKEYSSILLEESVEPANLDRISHLQILLLLPVLLQWCWWQSKLVPACEYLLSKFIYEVLLWGSMSVSIQRFTHLAKRLIQNSLALTCFPALRLALPWTKHLSNNPQQQAILQKAPSLGSASLSCA